MLGAVEEETTISEGKDTVWVPIIPWVAPPMHPWTSLTRLSWEGVCLRGHGDIGIGVDIIIFRCIYKLTMDKENLLLKEN